MEVEPDAEHVANLLAMGFAEEHDVRKALKLAKNDMSEAVAYLTHETPGLDIEMLETDSTGPSSSSRPDNRYNGQEMANEAQADSDSLEFPTTHLYELEGRVLNVSNWNVPYARHESLGRCLAASIRLAKEKLCESDDSCRRFMDRVLPTSFEKLLTSNEVQNKWGSETLDGIIAMLEMLMDFVAARLQYLPVPHELLRTFCIALDPGCNYHNRTKTRRWDKTYEQEVGKDNLFGIPNRQSNSDYGYLLALINRFADKGGFDSVRKLFDEAILDSTDMYSLLWPFRMCADFLNPQVAGPVLQPCVNKALGYVNKLSENDLRSNTVSAVVDLVSAVTELCRVLHFDENLDDLDCLRLNFILRLLKCPHFGARMLALKEVTKLLDALATPKKEKDRLAIPATKISEWLSKNEVLSLALEGNIDQLQYVDRLKTLLEFLGPQLSCQEITKIWSLRKGRTAVTVDNVYRIVGQAAVKFNDAELDHLLDLIERSWKTEEERGKERIISLLGRIGRETPIGYTQDKVADMLWKFSHLEKLCNSMVHYALSEQHAVVNQSTKDDIRQKYIFQCLSDIQKGVLVSHMIYHLKMLIDSVKQSRGNSAWTGGYGITSASERKRRIITDLVDKNQVIESICGCLYQIQKTAAARMREVPPRSSTPVMVGSVPAKEPSPVPNGSNFLLMPASAGGDNHQAEFKGVLEPDFGPGLILPDGNQYGLYVQTALEFLSFVLREANLSLSWARTKHLWETMAENESGCNFDKEACFKWFCELRDSDLTEDSRSKLLTEKLLRMDPTKLIPDAFQCFRKYFEIVNRNKGKLKEFSIHRPLEVDDLDLLGLDFVWEVALCCPNIDIVSTAVQMLIDLSYTQLGQRHKREPETLNRRFLTHCSSRLESSLISVKGSLVGRALSDAAKVLTVVPVPGMSSLSTVGHGNTKRSIERLLMIVSRYISTVEQDYKSARSIPPHGMTFFGKCFYITIISEVDGHKGEWPLLVHSNETLRSVRERIASRVGLKKDEVHRLEIEFNGAEVEVSKDQKLLRQLEMVPDQFRTFVALVVKKRITPPALYDSYNKDSKGESNNEKVLPSVMMTSSGQLFDLLHELTSLEEQSICDSVRQLLLLMPCDPSVSAVLDELLQPAPPTNATPPKSNSLERKLKNIASGDKRDKSPKLKLKGHSPKPSWVDPALIELPGIKLQKLLDGNQPFRLLYNLEVVSSRLLPTSLSDDSMRSAAQFCQVFIVSNGLQYLLALLKRDALPANLDVRLRQDIMSRLLHLLCYLLCGQSELHKIVACEREAERQSGSDARRSPTPGPSSSATATMAASAGIAAAAAAADDLISHSFGNLDTPRSFMAKDLNHDDFALVLESLQRVAWIAAAGMLQCGGACQLKSPRESNSSSVASPRNRTSESSTGSSEGNSTAELPTSIHAGVVGGQMIPTAADEDLAQSSVQLMVDCVLMRPSEVGAFFSLPHFADFVLDMLLMTSSEAIRILALQQLVKLAEGCTVETTLGLDSPKTNRSNSGSAGALKKLFLQKNSPSGAQVAEDSASKSTKGQPQQLLLHILLKAHLPLWSSNSQVRGSSRRLLGQCSEYFSLRSALLASLSPEAVAKLQPNASQMLNDEASWLLNFTCSTDPRAAETDSRLLAGHMRMIGTLIEKAPGESRKIGRMLLRPVLSEFLFPAASLVANLPDGEKAHAVRQVKAADMRARCHKMDGRLAAFELVEILCRGSMENFKETATLLTQLHHNFNAEMSKQWDYCPLVERKVDSGYIGLKNAGATCYMNSVLQQFFMEPAIPEAILAAELEEDADKESVLGEVQRLFGNLRESELQYYTPKKFWDIFRLWGQQVNPREQQDAFEFYTCLIDQLDTQLKQNKQDQIFRRKYQGVFSDQKICHGCPHRYEREEAFYALNLPLRAHGLEESLNQFVKGEILEADNAYYCEKCKQKRTTLKRMCIKNLPSVLVIQLKRFGYDWEENRALKFNDHFQFPRSLDMYPYTVSALNQSECVEDLFDQSSQSANLSASYANPPLSAGNTPLNSPLSAPNLWRKTSSFDQRPATLGTARYDLVGAVVHSGQANAGHYYAFIKERREEAVLNGNYNKWFKFNDTTVEEVDMNDTFMETELFGGRYTVKTDKPPLFPEERERYWNAYLLLYERSSSAASSTSLNAPTPKTTASKRSISVGISSPTVPTVKTPRRRDSFGELAALVEQGERQRIFRDPGSIPATLREEIREENLLFAKNRDIYNTEYFTFVSKLVDRVIWDMQQMSDDEARARLGREGVLFSIEFLLNVCWHTKKSLRGDAHAWVIRIQRLLRASNSACEWLFAKLCSELGLKALDDLLFDCDSAEIRYAFSQVLLDCFKYGSSYLSESNLEPDDASDKLVRHLLSLIKTEAASQPNRSSAFFGVLYGYAQIGPNACQHLLSCGAFRLLLDFMIEMPTSDTFWSSRVLSLKRRWIQSQAKDFGAVYNTLATLILSCDMTPFHTVPDAAPVPRFSSESPPVEWARLECPREVQQVVLGPMMPAFVKELLWALSAVYNTQNCLCELVLRASYANETFSRAVIAESLRACAGFAVNELKRIFHLLELLLTLIEDQLQNDRIDFVLDGVQGGNGILDAEGLLAIVKSAHTGDSRRSYNCVKFLVQLADRFTLVKEALNQRMDGWSWAVDWLKSRMSEHDATNTTTYTSSYSSQPQSNEDCISRSFQRTVSAQYTLDHATALLTEFEGLSPNPKMAEEEDSGGHSMVEIECSDEAAPLESPKKTGKSQFYVGT